MYGRRRLELWWLYGLIAACGAPTEHAREEPPADDAMATGGGEAESAADAARAQVAPVLREIVPDPRLELQRLTPLELTPRPSEPAHVILVLHTLEPGAVYRPPSGPCQDVLVYVREGEPRAVGTGIAPPQAPSTLYPGDAVRFGPEGDGLLQNLTDAPVRTLLVFTRSDAPPSLDEAAGECPFTASRDPTFVPIRSASVRSTQAYAALGGALRVRILLDSDGAGARHGGISALDGDPGLTVPEHRHEDAAEILYVEEGAGTMRIGEREVTVRSGMALYVPRGVLHDFRGDGTHALRAIQIYTPSGAEQRFRRSAPAR